MVGTGLVEHYSQTLSAILRNTDVAVAVVAAGAASDADDKTLVVHPHLDDWDCPE